MKTKESRTPAIQAKAGSPFFAKKGARGGFFDPWAGGSQFFSGDTGRSSTVQTKLTVGSPNDVYEKQADAMADQVVQRMSEPVGHPTAGREMSQASDRGLQRVMSTAPAIQEKCAHCEQEEKKEMEEDRGAPKEKLQKKPIFESNAEQPDEDESVQRKTDGASAQKAPADVEGSIRASKGGGSPLPGKTRHQMESSFGR